MKIQEKNYNCIDLVKCVMAVFVIAMHTVPLANCQNRWVLSAWESLVRPAVPFFFLCTGFFLGNRKDAPPDSPGGQAVIGNYLKKTVKLYAFWSAVYAPLAILFFYRSGYSLFKAAASWLIGFFLVGENYNSWMLWYLLSSIYAIVFVLLLLRWKQPLRRITVLGAIVYLLGLLLTEFIRYEGSLPGIVSMVQTLLGKTISSGRIFTGFFFIPMGMLLAEKKTSLKVGIPLLFCGFFADIFLGGLAEDGCRACSAIGIFLIVSNLRLNPHPVYPALRRASTTLYFTHMYVWTAYYALVYGEKRYGPDSFIATTLVCLGIAFLSELRRKRPQ